MLLKHHKLHLTFAMSGSLLPRIGNLGCHSVFTQNLLLNYAMGPFVFII